MSTTTVKYKKETEINPRLAPIEKPDSLKLKLTYWFTKRRIGKVITPVKVHYVRFPEAIGLSKKLIDLDQKFTIGPRLKHLIKVYVATLNGCGFCIDIGKASAQQNQLDPEIFDNLLRFDESDLFTDAEKAALTFAGEVTQNMHIDDSTFERLQRYFSEREIVQIILINAIENFYNFMNVPMNIGSDELCQYGN